MVSSANQDPLVVPFASPTYILHYTSNVTHNQPLNLFATSAFEPGYFHHAEKMNVRKMLTNGCQTQNERRENHQSATRINDEVRREHGE